MRGGDHPDGQHPRRTGKALRDAVAARADDAGACGAVADVILRHAIHAGPVADQPHRSRHAVRREIDGINPRPETVAQLRVLEVDAAVYDSDDALGVAGLDGQRFARTDHVPRLSWIDDGRPDFLCGSVVFGPM